MCSMYWNLKVSVLAPCGHQAESNLQTHFMGAFGSCMNYYGMHEPVDELDGFTGDIPFDHWLIGECGSCKKFFYVPARCESGQVVELDETVTPEKYTEMATGVA